MGNRMITFVLGQAAYLGLVYYIFGGRALSFHLLYSLIMTLMFETVNYLEHYGLQRKLIPGSTDVYESVKITHSWNAPHVVTNYILFKLQRHSDHHANSYKPYQVLDSFTESPMLPYGYAISLIISTTPSVWKHVIDPMAIATNKGEKLDEKVLKDQEVWVLSTLFFNSIVITYLTFFVVGFN